MFQKLGYRWRLPGIHRREIEHMIQLRVQLKKWYWLLALFGILTLPSIFLGFDQHHGGLIHATLTTTRAAYFNDGALPFNQYGPFWVFIYGLFYIVISPSYSFLSIKIFTYLLYSITLFVTYKFATRYLDRLRSLFVVLFMLATYPFYSGNLPWPSSITMLTIPIIGLLLNRILHNDSFGGIKRRFSTSKNDRTLLLLLGFLVATVFQTRVQVGFLLLIFMVYLFSSGIFHKKSFCWTYFLLGFLVTNLFTYTILFSRGWLQDSLADQFIFGASYITGDKSTYPIPKWTIFLTLSFTFIYFGLLRIQRIGIPTTLSWLTVCFLLLLVFIYIFDISARNGEFNGATLIVWKRFWISLLLSSAVIYSVILIKHRIQTRGVDRNHSDRTILIGLSLISLVQLFPLFDEMHAWWGSTPGFILVILVLEDIRIKISGNLFPKVLIAGYFLFSIAIGAQTAGQAIADSGQSQFAAGLKGVYVNKQNLKSQLLISKFLEENISRSNSVLNLCTNPNIFFESKYHSASRSIVFWTPIFADRNLRAEILHSKPDKILTCSTTTNPRLEVEYLRAQKEALRGISLKPKLIAATLDPKGGEWKIWIP